MEFETSFRRLANVVPPPGQWRMLMICVIYAMTLAQSAVVPPLIYTMTLAQSLEGAMQGSCVIKS